MQNILPIERVGCSAPTSQLAPIWEMVQAASNTLGTRSVGTCSEAGGSLLTFMLESSFTSMPMCWCSEVLKFASQQYKQTEGFFPLSPSQKVRIGSERLHSQWWPVIPYTLQGPDASCLAFQINLLFAVDQCRKELLSRVFVFIRNS